MNAKLIFKATLCLLGAGTFSQTAVAQDIYDDIYGSSEPQKSVPKPQPTAPASYPAADTYNFDSGSTRSVDEYNRRGIFAPADTTVSDAMQRADSLAAVDFNCTRQIERYYNPDVVVGSSDADLAQLYYSQPANINIIINTPGYYDWGWPYYSPYSPWGWSYSSYWGWNSYWGPSWNWAWGPGWGWGPSWSWGWGSGWGWGPGWDWGPGWGPGWSRPYNPRHPGALAHNRPGYGGGQSASSGRRPGAVNTGSSYHGQSNAGWNGGNGNRPTANGTSGSTSLRPGASGNRPGQTASSNPSTSATVRPSTDIRNRPTQQQTITNTNTQRYTTTVRPGATSHGFTTGSSVGNRPSNTSTTNRGYRPGSTSTSTPRQTYQQQTTTRNNYQPQRQTTTRNNNNSYRPSNRNSTPSYNSGSSRGGYSGGSRGGSYGGGRHGGGGGGRH